MSILTRIYLFLLKAQINFYKSINVLMVSLDLSLMQGTDTHISNFHQDTIEKNKSSIAP